MKKDSILSLGTWLVLLAMAAAACAPQPAVQSSPTLPPAASPLPSPAAYTDPFAYCAAIGNVDAPDARYTGPRITDSIVNGFKVAAGLEASSAPAEQFAEMTIWRCMNGQVYACNFGANLPCDSKANTDKNPTQAMKDFCQENPDVEFIPMYVTGHATIYSWRCVQGAAELLDQIGEVDASGFLAQIWYPIRHDAGSPIGTP